METETYKLDEADREAVKSFFKLKDSDLDVLLGEKELLVFSDVESYISWLHDDPDTDYVTNFLHCVTGEKTLAEYLFEYAEDAVRVPSGNIIHLY